MAAPVVAGTAALILAYYPDLTPQQVRQIILESTVKYPNQKVLLPSEGNQDSSETKLFPQLSVSDGLVNVYNALQAAEKLNRQ
jgi:subtilisin family serine protease